MDDVMIYKPLPPRLVFDSNDDVVVDLCLLRGTPTISDGAGCEWTWYDIELKDIK